MSLLTSVLHFSFCWENACADNVASQGLPGSLVAEPQLIPLEQEGDFQPGRKLLSWWLWLGTGFVPADGL